MGSFFIRKLPVDDREILSHSRGIGLLHLHYARTTPVALVAVLRLVYNEQDSGHRYENLTSTSSDVLNCNNCN